MKSAERLSISLTIFGISTKMSYSNTPKVNNYQNIKKCPGSIPQKEAILNKFAFLEKHTCTILPLESAGFGISTRFYYRNRRENEHWS